MSDRADEDTGARQALLPQLFRNSAIGLVCRIISAVLALGVVPFMISQVGVAGFGMWETIVSLVSILYLVQSVMSGTLLWWMSHAYGKDDLVTLQRAAGIGLTFICAVALVMVPLVYLAREAVLPLFQAPPAVQVEITRILPIYAAVYALSGGNEILAAMAGASQRMGQALIIQTIARLAQYTIACVGLVSGFGLRSMVAGHAVGSIICGLLLVRFLRRLYPTLHFFPLIPTRAEITALYRYMGFMTISGVATVVREQSDKLILAAFASPVWVGYYAIATRLAALLLDFHRFFYPHLLTAAGALAARDDWDGLRRLYLKVTKSVAICTGFMGILVIGGYDRLLVAWLGASPPEVSPMLYLLVLANSASVLLTGSALALCRGIGRVRTETTYLLASLVINLAGTILLVFLFGPMGTVYATAGTALVCGILFAWQFHRNIPVPVAGVMHAVYAYSIAMLIAGMVRAFCMFLPAPTERFAALASYAAVVLPASALYVAVLVRVGLVRVSGIREMFARS
jgi:O-antigen/teichoic acid export membrane protein